MVTTTITVGSGTVITAELVDAGGDTPRVILRIGPHLVVDLDELVADNLADALIEATVTNGPGA